MSTEPGSVYQQVTNQPGIQGEEPDERRSQSNPSKLNLTARKQPVDLTLLHPPNIYAIMQQRAIGRVTEMGGRYPPIDAQSMAPRRLQRSPQLDDVLDQTVQCEGSQDCAAVRV
jgi:hypothetical protein